jgi:predicted transcriptional regulator
MNKRRVTVNLDEDVVEALEALGGRSLSAVANDALRQAVTLHAHRAALSRWLDELDDVHGRVTPEQAASIDALVEELEEHSASRGIA